MKSTTLRILIPLAVLLVAGIGFALHIDLGTLSAVGWQDISLLCPLGALGTMLASKMVIPRAVISLVVAVVAIILLGRAFCGWICPVPVIEKLRTVFKKQPSKSQADKDAQSAAKAQGEGLTAEEKALLKKGCSSCKACAPANSRHLVLGGALLSAAIFGFPVFCLICPIGLSFALVFVLILLFGGGDVTWSVVAIPALLLVEVVFFRKWCSHICPLSALMSLVGKLNKTFRPSIDDDKCLETSHGAVCGKCAEACEVGIDPRHPENGAPWSECTKCRACVEACPGHAISMPLLAPKANAAQGGCAACADGAACATDQTLPASDDAKQSE